MNLARVAEEESAARPAAPQASAILAKLHAKSDFPGTAHAIARLQSLVADVNLR